MNLEEGGANFVINWNRGSISTASTYHIVGESSGGSKKVNLTNVTVAGGRDAATNALACHFYSYTNSSVQKKADITRNNGPVTYYGFMA